MRIRPIPSSLVLLAVLILGGCAGKAAFRNAQQLSLQGDYDGAVSEYMAAVERRPDVKEYRVRLDETLAKAAWHHLEEGRRLMAEKQAAAAAAEFRKALEYDQTLKAAENELAQAERLQRVDRLVAQADEFVRNRRLQQARNSLDEALLIDPENAAALALLEKVRSGPKAVVDGIEIDMTSTKPITLKFKETDIKDAFSILSKLTGVNFILDDEVKKQKFSFELTDVSFPQAIELILQMHKLGKKVLNSRTIIIYSKSKDGEKQFGDQIIQTFYLSSIDAKKAVNLLRTMLKLRQVYVHEELNAIVVRDTPDVIKLAGQILEAADRADAEVMFDLELIEVNHNDQLNFGPKLSANAISYGLGKIGEVASTSGTATTGSVIVSGGLESGGSTANLVTSLSNLRTFYTLPTLTFDFLKTRSDSEILANPKIRVKNREKAKVHIGSKEPVITVTINGDNQSDNVTYVDVGVKLDVEPTIQLDNTVVTKLQLEVSSVSSRQTTKNGTQVLTLTTTNAQSSLTLKDGERTIIGGLVRDDKSKSKTGVAFLSDLPLIGQLFNSHTNTKSKREILLSITPHIVQNVLVPGAEVGTIWSGGEDDLKAGPVFGAYTVYEPEKDGETPTPAAATPPQSGNAVTPAAPLFPEAFSENPPVAEPPRTEPSAIPESVPPAAEPVPAAESLPPSASPSAEGIPAVSAAPPVAAANLVEVPPFTVPPAGDGRLLVSGPPAVAVGEAVVLDVRGMGMKGLYSAPLFINYDPALFDLVRVEEGDFLKQGGATTVFTTSPLAGRGEVIVGYKQGVGATGASGDGLLFRIMLRAKAPGSGSVRLDRLNLRDASGNRLKVDATPLTLEVR